MERPAPHLDAERLLAESGWVRNLVRRLVRDASLVEDVVQDAWVTALERPPSGGKVEAVWRAWIARVARSRVRQHRRSEQRRVDRERQVVDPTASAPSTFEVVARTQLLQRVVAAVLELDEPYRSAVLWRFYDDLPMREIARRQGIREENARQRVARGLDRLRARLDDEHGGDGRSWAVALAPLCSLRTGAGATVSLGTGTLIMGKTTGIVLALAAATAGVFLLGPWRARASAPPGEPAPLVVDTTAHAQPDAVDRSQAAPAPARTTVLEVEASPSTLAPSWTVRARIVDPEGASVPGATLEVVGAEGAPAPADVRGDVELRLLDLPIVEAQDRRYVRYLARAPGHAPCERIETAPDGAGVIELGEVRLFPVGVLTGLVVDRSGRGLPDAEVCLARSALGASGAADRAILGPDWFAVVQRTRSDASGRFRLADVESGAWRAWAGASESRWSTSDVLALERGLPWPEVVLTLEPLGANEAVRGLVLASDGRPLAHASIQVALEGAEYSMSAESAADGRFSVAVPAGLPLLVSVVDPEQHHRPETRTGVVGSAAELVFALREARAVSVMVHDERGEPIAHPLLRVDLAAPYRQEFYRPDEERPGGGGRVHVPLPERPFALVAMAEGYATAELAALDPDTVPDELALELRRLALVSGRVLADGEPLDGAIVQLVRVARPGSVDYIDGFPARLDGTELQGAQVGADGRFALAITTRGSFALFAEHPGFAAAELGPLELDPERAVKMDIELGLGGAVEGRVLVPTGESPAGVLVRVSRGDMRVHEGVADAAGRYRIERLAPGPYMVQATRERRGQDLAFSATAVDSADGVETTVFAWAFEVRAGETTRHDVDLQRQGRGGIEGRVRVDGRVPAGAARLVPCERPWMERSFETREVELDADGGFAFPEPRPGRYRVVVAFHAGALAGSELVRTVEVANDPVRCDLELATARASGRVPGDAAGPFALLANPAPDVLCVTPLTVTDGSFDAVALAAGPARLVAWHEGLQRTDPTRWDTAATFEAPPGALVRVVP